ncbi:uncharacterized protein Dwil_GK14298 [Drosophila willistoni]|uniref:Doublesex dimerisation domain-containing protein n=1 Tax=Drosophila willistoni TaxID=7260 RepID=A0A0Q9X501_DROWI|nr:uncharacterized protein Dwil_GK14298 [Drosophila willistoni]
MPLMYVILKDAGADIEEASRRIEEARIEINRIVAQLYYNYYTPMALVNGASMYLTYPSIEQGRYGTHFTHLPLTQIRPPTPEPIELSRSSPNSPSDGGTTGATSSKQQQASPSSSSSNGVHSAASPTAMVSTLTTALTSSSSASHSRSRSISNNNIRILGNVHDQPRPQPHRHRLRHIAAVMAVQELELLPIINIWSAQQPRSIEMLLPLWQQLQRQLCSLCK